VINPFSPPKHKLVTPLGFSPRLMSQRTHPS